MHIIRRANDRGFTDLGWLQSRHTFSFGDYHDPSHMGFGPLRVLNEDRVGPGAGFNRHPHKDMEILSWVLAGTLEHKDSLGNGSKIRPGDLQRMTAGTGVTHSEFNASASEPVHFLQIWIIPARRGLAPSYQQVAFEPADFSGRWLLIGSCVPDDAAVTVHQDVSLYATRMAPGDERVHVALPRRLLWLQILRGEVQVDHSTLVSGDAAAWTDGSSVRIHATSNTEALLFDMTSQP
jgi:redox-sensitive bicupin YhaK (pirin superfamily)